MDESTLPDPPARARRLLGGPARVSIEVKLRTVTPILGGGAAARALDPDQPIRGSGVRGQLRFWWRALYGHACSTAAELADREAEIWGEAGADQRRRSRVDLHVSHVNMPKTAPREHPEDRSSINAERLDAYALWPARGNEKARIAIAPRWKPGISFKLRLDVDEPHVEEVTLALRAWILFGGYGSRVRRGCGSLTVEDADHATWLPKTASRAELLRTLGGLPLLDARAAGAARPTPLLQGARLLHHASMTTKAEDAWMEALGWLKDFRQQMPTRSNQPAEDFARRYPDQPPLKRAGISNWPEADKIRCLAAKLPGAPPEWQHAPRHNAAPAWPRASFGLPIIGQFQRSSRNKGPDGRLERYPRDEPPDFELRWRDAQGKDHDRLASPLILKPLPLAGGRFAPIALWLGRAYPEGGQVVLVFPKERSSRKEPIRGSEAPFDALVAEGDTPLYRPLQTAPGQGMRDVFCAWLKSTRRAQELG